MTVHRDDTESSDDRGGRAARGIRGRGGLRIELALLAGLAIGLAGAARASAQSSTGHSADAPDSGSVQPCPQNIDAGVRAALGTTLQTGAPISCRFVRSATQRDVRGVVTAGKIEGAVRAEAALSDGRTAVLEVSPDGRVGGVNYLHGDLTGSAGKGMALLFWVFALASVIGAVFVVSRRNLIAAVMGMVGSFLGIAAIYMMLYAQFLAVIQMLVYAGAIMVLFVFVVMILNRPEDEPVAPSGRGGQALGGVAILYLIGRLIVMLTQVEPPDPVLAAAAPLPTHEGFDWGSIRAVGTDLFGAGLFPFEAVSILLLVAVVGAIAIARPLHAEDDAPAKAREGGVA
jgi:NADH-quinone oxidoreductase subunit J